MMLNKHEKQSDSEGARKLQKVNQTVTRSRSTSKRQHLHQLNHKKQKFKDVFIEDVYEKAQSAKTMIKKKTGLVYDIKMANHCCPWWSNHIECPDRLSKSLERCEELGLLERCQRICVRRATEEELLTVHTRDHIDRLAATTNCQDLEYLESLASKYDAIYIHPETYELSLLAAGSTIQLVDDVCAGTVQNGMAIIRPPGHHAMQQEFCGFCYFNNVAIAAHHALDKHHLQRILVIDWDVHHGQATQQMFYHDPRVVYFSIHRYEHGEFWPNLRESDYDYVGDGDGLGYNFNVPLNSTGLGDTDYMAIFQQVLLPMALEYQPELVIVSAGYDAALGCPEGEMKVSPSCYAHLVSSLMGLASGKIAVILEGGYCVPSLAEGVALTLRALLRDPCPSLVALDPPSESIQESILNCIYSHRQFWRCFQSHRTFSVKDRDASNKSQHWPRLQYNYDVPKMESYPTRDCCPVQSDEVKLTLKKMIENLILETKLLKPKQEVCFVYDELMMEHTNLNDPDHPEKPSRIKNIYETHMDYNLLSRLNVLKSRFATKQELLLVHTEDYLVDLEQLCASTMNMTPELKHHLDILEKKNSVYIHPRSYEAASLAAGSLLQVVDSVMQGESKAGVAVVRPPGHHAESYEACGFCMFNNISLAAKYAIKTYSIERVLILDWDVHHGNGTQRLFLSDPQVLYISIHRYDRGNFFPSTNDGAATVVGSGPGIGFNVNIAWNQKRMGNAEYVAAFLQVVLPIAYQFAPDLVLVSAGFDAAVGDPIGACNVCPETYALLTSWLAPLAMGRLILCLEGGYNLTSISYAMTLCTKTLLGDPVPSVDQALPVKSSATNDLNTVLNIQSKYWSALAFNKVLPKEDVFSKSVPTLVDSLINDDLLSKMSMLEIGGICNKNNVVSNEPIDWESRVVKVSDNDTTNKTEMDNSHIPGPSSSTNQINEALTSLSLPEELRQELGLDEGHAVHPSFDCPHVQQAVMPVPESGIDLKAPCIECLSNPCATQENWICLTCYSVHCGRFVNQHMVGHSEQLAHPIVLGFSDLSIWCYSCASYIESPVLYGAKNTVHESKFGESMPNIYNNFISLTHQSK